MSRPPRPPGSKPIALDDVSKAIIEQLQGDGRRSYAEIGKAVGLSEAAVRQRVQKLTDSGVMQVVAVTDPMQLGFYRQAMIGIRVSGDTTTVAEKLAVSERRVHERRIPCVQWGHPLRFDLDETDNWFDPARVLAAL